jgi:hypothetical protein
MKGKKVTGGLKSISIEYKKKIGKMPFTFKDIGRMWE